jgi:hypothetical protein
MGIVTVDKEIRTHLWNMDHCFGDV